MLCLDRKKGQKTFITVPPSDRTTVIAVSVCEVSGNKAKLGFEAPTNAIIHREEAIRKRK